jgi:hypothetical protein
MSGAQALLRRLAAALAAAGIAGCATPNLQPFADHTAALATAVSGEQWQISLKLAQVADLWKEACAAANRARALGQAVIGDPCKQEQARRENIKGYEESRRIIDALMEKGVDYAGSLAELAKAGETGSAAANSLLGTVKQFGTMFGVGTSFITGTVASAVQNIAAAVTRIQAQQTLGEATWAANETIVVVADSINEIYGEAAGNVVVGLYSEEAQVRLELAGRNLVGLFQDAALSREASSQRLRDRRDALVSQRCAQAKPLPDECKLLEAELKTAEDIGRLLDRMRPEYDNYVAKREAAARWFKGRAENHAAIRKAVAEWKTEHIKLASQLGRCGGLNASRCVELNATTLKVLVDRVNDIRSGKVE